MVGTEGNVESGVRVVVRPLGNPLPLGLVGLAGATLVLSGLQLRWLPTTQSHHVAIVLIVFAAPAQLLAAMLAFLARDGAAGLGIATQALTWLSTGAILITSPAGARSPTLGLLLFVAAVGVAIAAVSTAWGKWVVAAVLTLTSLRFLVTGVYEFVGGHRWETAAGWIGVVLCALAGYVAFAADLEDVRHQPSLPLGRHDRGRQAAHGATGAGTDLYREPGVREQL